MRQVREHIRQLESGDEFHIRVSKNDKANTMRRIRDDTLHLTNDDEFYVRIHKPDGTLIVCKKEKNRRLKVKLTKP